MMLQDSFKPDFSTPSRCGANLDLKHMRKAFEQAARMLLCSAMNSNDAYTIHTDYDEILKEVNGLEGESQTFKKATVGIIDALRNTSVRLKPLMSRQLFEQDEGVLWKNYQQLQEERLSILDFSHEWNYLKETSSNPKSELDAQIRDAIDELVEHITVLEETLRAHIDIIEIQSSRRLSLIAIVLSVIISYLAVWYFLVKDFILNVVFSGGLSPDLNYIMTLLSLAPIFFVIAWGWRERVKT
jgi:hypothetical protein